MRKKIQFTLAILFFSISIGIIHAKYIKRTKGFSVKKICSAHKYSPRWDFGEPSTDQLTILNAISSEPFFLIGSGKECYAFGNKSGTLVIKFFKQQRMRTQSILNHLPLPKYLRLLHQEKINQRKYKRNRTFTSYQIAYENFLTETGLLYLHLNKSKKLNRHIILIDQKGKSHKLQMDDMEFVVQKQAHPIVDRINFYMDKKDIKGAKATISSILNLITKRLELGILDRDTNCMRNIGLIGDKAIHIDAGEFYSSKSSKPKVSDFLVSTNDLYTFLEVSYPSLAIFLKKEIENIANQL